MQGMGEGGDNCPFEFNFDETSFKPGDVVSYRVTGGLADWPFVGTLVEVHDDYVIIAGDPQRPEVLYRAPAKAVRLLTNRKFKPDC